MNIIILGPQGSGKGTQAKLLVDKLGLYNFESGDFLREVAKSNSMIDRLINQKGVLLPDGVVFSLVSEFLEQKIPTRDNILFDGYPRSIKQYDLLKDWLSESGTKINFSIFIDIREKESISRLSARRICIKCGNVYNLITNPPPSRGCECGGELIQRSDDSESAIAERLKEYKKTTHPLIELLKKEKILIKVDGEKPIDKIFADIMAKIENKNEQ